MVMGIYGLHGYTISLDNLREVCPEETKAVEVLGVDWGTIAQATDGDFYESTEQQLADGYTNLDTANKITAAVKVLYTTFNDRTGLDLSLCYYDKDMGDLYDDVPNEGGCVFLLDGVIQFTPAAERIRDKIHTHRGLVGGGGWIQCTQCGLRGG